MPATAAGVLLPALRVWLSGLALHQGEVLGDLPSILGRAVQPAPGLLQHVNCMQAIGILEPRCACAGAAPIWLCGRCGRQFAQPPRRCAADLPSSSQKSGGTEPGLQFVLCQLQHLLSS